MIRDSQQIHTLLNRATSFQGAQKDNRNQKCSNFHWEKKFKCIYFLQKFGIKVFLGLQESSISLGCNSGYFSVALQSCDTIASNLFVQSRIWDERAGESKQATDRWRASDWVRDKRVSWQRKNESDSIVTSVVQCSEVHSSEPWNNDESSRDIFNLFRIIINDLIAVVTPCQF